MTTIKWIYDPESNCIVTEPRPGVGGGVAYEEVIDGDCIKDRRAAERLAELENLYPGNSWYKQLDILIHEGLADEAFGGDSDPSDTAPNPYFELEQ